MKPSVVLTTMSCACYRPLRNWTSLKSALQGTRAAETPGRCRGIPFRPLGGRVPAGDAIGAGAADSSRASGGAAGRAADRGHSHRRPCGRSRQVCSMTISPLETSISNVGKLHVGKRSRPQPQPTPQQLDTLQCSCAACEQCTIVEHCQHSDRCVLAQKPSSRTIQHLSCACRGKALLAYLDVEASRLAMRLAASSSSAAAGVVGSTGVAETSSSGGGGGILLNSLFSRVGHLGQALLGADAGSSGSASNCGTRNVGSDAAAQQAAATAREALWPQLRAINWCPVRTVFGESGCSLGSTFAAAAGHSAVQHSCDASAVSWTLPPLPLIATLALMCIGCR